MNPMPELSPMLKQLRLSGIMATLEQRNREAIKDKLSFTEFLALLIQDEVARRDQKRYDVRFRRASFRGEKTIENFDFAFNPTVNQALVLDLATGRFIDEKACVLIAGPCGTGKSHLAQAIGRAAVQRGHDVLFTTQSQLGAQLHAARATDSYERRFSYYAKVPLLIIDDFGLKPLRTPQDEDIHDLIAERYESASTIVTSNLDFSEWGDAFPNRLLGAATLDRLRHGAHLITLDGKSYREARPHAEEEKKKGIANPKRAA